MISPEEFNRRMQAIADENEADAGDQQACHIKADELLCEALEGRGYARGVAIFRAMVKWYEQ